MLVCPAPILSMSAEPALTVSAALNAVLARAAPLGNEHVALEGVLGRVLTEAIRADIDMPPFDRSAMDGFALRAADAGAVPARLRVIGEVRAGEQSSLTVGPGEAVAIMTGAPVPAGADAVQQVEKTAAGGGFVEILAAVEKGANIAPMGSEVRAGHEILAPGRVIDPATVAVLAAVGRHHVLVGKRPTVAILATGDELVAYHQRPAAAQIRNSNGPTLRAQALWAGAHAVVLGTARDNEEALVHGMEPGLDADILVVSGGVSAGAYDLVEDIFDKLGVIVEFRRVAIKPGAPLVFGHRGKALIFGLPGNPVSTQVTFDLFVRPAILRMQGAAVLARPAVSVVLAEAVTNRSGREAHLPAFVRSVGGRFVAAVLPSRGSADIVRHAHANALVVMAADRVAAGAGEMAPAILMGAFLERGDGNSEHI
jgi:molybdopterin molybdotransferase